MVIDRLTCRIIGTRGSLERRFQARLEPMVHTEVYQIHSYDDKQGSLR